MRLSALWTALISAAAIQVAHAYYENVDRDLVDAFDFREFDEIEPIERRVLSDFDTRSVWLEGLTTRELVEEISDRLERRAGGWEGVVRRSELLKKAVANSKKEKEEEKKAEKADKGAQGIMDNFRAKRAKEEEELRLKREAADRKVNSNRKKA